MSSNFFATSKNHTVTRFASEHGVPAMQLEINATWLDPAGGDLAVHHFAALLDALTDFLRTQNSFEISLRLATGCEIFSGVAWDSACGSLVFLVFLSD